MNSKHLSTGSPCPPLRPGTLRIYSMRFCPYAQRSLLVAFAKGVPLDIVNVNLKQKPEWLAAKNPAAAVPTIETPGGCVYESLVVSDYLDEAYPGPHGSLYPSDPLHKALDRIWVKKVDQIADAYTRIVFSGGDQQKFDSGVEETAAGLVVLGQELKRRGTTYFGGQEAPGMLDYMLWPWIERVPALGLCYGPKLEEQFKMEKFPILGKWAAAMEADPNGAVQATHASPEHHAEYRKSGAGGAVPNYDLLAN